MPPSTKVRWEHHSRPIRRCCNTRHDLHHQRSDHHNPQSPRPTYPRPSSYLPRHHHNTNANKSNRAAHVTRWSQRSVPPSRITKSSTPLPPLVHGFASSAPPAGHYYNKRLTAQVPISPFPFSPFLHFEKCP
jgi:hypothetical protein